ncbi:MAG: helix-turn-helix domain-containing protein [Bdellovibrionales bacterium]|nr:helix-turn-helix domain-containing protein [Bdellovibrionales bacterium]
MAKRDFKVIGNYLREKRVGLGIAQIEVSKALGFTSPQYVSNWERGLAPPPSKSLKAIAEILGIDKKELIRVLMKMEEEYLLANICGKRKKS